MVLKSTNAFIYMSLEKGANILEVDAKHMVLTVGDLPKLLNLGLWQHSPLGTCCASVQKLFKLLFADAPFRFMLVKDLLVSLYLWKQHAVGSCEVPESLLVLQLQRLLSSHGPKLLVLQELAGTTNELLLGASVTDSLSTGRRRWPTPNCS